MLQASFPSTARPVCNNITDAFAKAPANEQSDNNRQSTDELCEVGASAPCGPAHPEQQDDRQAQGKHRIDKPPHFAQKRAAGRCVRKSPNKPFAQGEDEVELTSVLINDNFGPQDQLFAAGNQSAIDDDLTKA